jgi:ankyrin repeat protein
VLSPAFEAARTGDEATLRKLFAEGWDALEEDRHGSNALLWAAGGGHLSVCKFLVEQCGVPVQPDDVKRGTASKHALKRRRNALHWAARHGHIEVCR